MKGNHIPRLQKINPDSYQPVLLFEEDDHQIFWLGIPEHKAFRSNTYLVKSGDQALLFDPGHRAYFDKVLERVQQIIEVEQLAGLVFCHQDPDVAASIIDWLKLSSDLPVMTSPRAHILLPYYGSSDYNWYDIKSEPTFKFHNDRSIKFIEAPFLHSAGAFASYDVKSGFLFSGDVWAAIQINWNLVVEDFAAHRQALDLFHCDYMASNLACRGFTEKLYPLQLNAILPQHGSIIDSADVPAALEYLDNLKCGVDLIYSHLSG